MRRIDNVRKAVVTNDRRALFRFPKHNANETDLSPSSPPASTSNARFPIAYSSLASTAVLVGYEDDSIKKKDHRNYLFADRMLRYISRQASTIGITQSRSGRARRRRRRRRRRNRTDSNYHHSTDRREDRVIRSVFVHFSRHADEIFS